MVSNALAVLNSRLPRCRRGVPASSHDQRTIPLLIYSRRLGVELVVEFTCQPAVPGSDDVMSPHS